MNNVVTALRRYPVKAMGGEALERVEVTPRGLRGDRQYAVQDADGKLVTGKNSKRFRRRDEIFEFNAVTEDDRVRVTRGDESWDATDPAINIRLAEILDLPVTVVPETTEPHFDEGSVSLIGTATLRWWKDSFNIDADPRRLRVNIVVETTEPFEEEHWIGRDLTIGEVTFRAVSQIPRCRMIDVPQDGADADQKWLKVLTREHNMNAAIYLDVITPGSIAVGDGVHLHAAH